MRPLHWNIAANMDGGCTFNSACFVLLGKERQLLHESLAISTELGMRPLMERVLSRREILKA